MRCRARRNLRTACPQVRYSGRTPCLWCGQMRLDFVCGDDSCKPLAWHRKSEETSEPVFLCVVIFTITLKKKNIYILWIECLPKGQIVEEWEEAGTQKGKKEDVVLRLRRWADTSLTFCFPRGATRAPRFWRALPPVKRGFSPCYFWASDVWYMEVESLIIGSSGFKMGLRLKNNDKAGFY